jgi:hypothetical protein
MRVKLGGPTIGRIRMNCDYWVARLKRAMTPESESNRTAVAHSLAKAANDLISHEPLT